MANWDQRAMSPPDSAYILIYLPSINRFIDEDNNVMHDLSDLFDAWELNEWKKHQDYDILLDRKGDWCELYYPSPCEENYYLHEMNMAKENYQLDVQYRQKAFCYN